MNVVVITSCTGEKTASPESQLTREDFAHPDMAHLASREAELAPFACRAEDIYTGLQHIRLMEGVRQFRESGVGTVGMYILSAGYGLVPGERSIVPYECTFQGMKNREIHEWSHHLNVPSDARKLFASIEADLVLVLLGDSYLRALELDDSVEFASPALFFTSTKSHTLVHGKGQWRTVQLANKDAKRFSCGLVGLKGELAKRTLMRLTDAGDAFTQQVFDGTADVLSLLGPSAGDVPSKARAACTPNPLVDKVIQIPESWWEKPHRSKLMYFIPEWDDLVDPDFDFETDTHSGGSGDWSNQVYAHQMFPEPNYDGILISKVVAEQSKKKKERINALGVHRYLRVPREFPIMGDCGAFGYINEEMPPYTTDEILDYYTRLGFDFGVSIDHLIVSATESQRKQRYELTIANAADFIREHKKQDLPWEPIGAVQGWDPSSYAEAAKKYVDMGYKYIALGGMVRSSTPDILRVLEAVRPVVPSDVRIHIFGVARLNAIHSFARLGVRSADSASYLRQAWIRAAQGYLLDDSSYATIRIPEAGKSFRAKRMIADRGLSEALVLRMEEDALRSLRALAEHNCSVEACLSTVMEYDQHITSDRTDMSALYRRTLEERPWERCDCALCRSAGVEMVLFRGNNRNRRRGFHNTYVFYRLLQSIVCGDTRGLGFADVLSSSQLSLCLGSEGTA